MPHKDPIKRKEYGDKWRKDNLAKCYASNKKYRTRTLEKSRAYQKEWKIKNPDKSAAQYKRLVARRLLNPIKYLVGLAKARAKRMGLEFNITIEDLTLPWVCPVFGTSFDIDGKRGPNSPSIDRIDPTKGYIKGNVAIISWRANEYKSNMSVKQIRLLFTYVEKYTK